MRTTYDFDPGLRSKSAMLCVPRRHGDYPAPPMIYQGARCQQAPNLADLHHAGACAPFAPRSPGPAAPTFTSPTRLSMPRHTVHQERYNPLKVGYQSQEASAKVRQDFGVISVTWPG
jgi:hypothetical protein